MLSLLLSQPHFAKLFTTVFVATQLLVWIATAQAGDASPPVVPPPDELTVVRSALREFDRFLDHHPMLEDKLRLNPALIETHDFLKHSPELRAFLRENPEVLPGLKTYPRYFLYRALLRQASAPLRYVEIAQLNAVFDQQPALQQALNENPELIRDPAFLQAQTLLRDFLTQHPIVSQAFPLRPTTSAKYP